MSCRDKPSVTLCRGPVAVSDAPGTMSLHCVAYRDRHERRADDQAKAAVQAAVERLDRGRTERREIVLHAGPIVREHRPVRIDEIAR